MRLLVCRSTPVTAQRERTTHEKVDHLVVSKNRRCVFWGVLINRDWIFFRFWNSKADVIRLILTHPGHLSADQQEYHPIEVYTQKIGKWNDEFDVFHFHPDTNDIFQKQSQSAHHLFSDPSAGTIESPPDAPISRSSFHKKSQVSI